MLLDKKKLDINNAMKSKKGIKINIILIGLLVRLRTALQEKTTKVKIR